MWQGIDSAPRDGSVFIGWDGKYAFKCQLVKHYDKWPHQEGGPTFRDVWSGIYYDSHMPEHPTHWTQIPETK